MSFYLDRVLALHSRLSRRAVISSVFGQPWREPAILLPKNIADAVRCFRDSLSSETAEDWLDSHTLFPFFSAFLNKDAQRRLYIRLLEGGYGPAHHCGGRLLPRRRFVRVCEECAAADLAKLGFYRIRRSHMVPYVSCCAYHHRSLIEAAKCDYSSIPTGPSHACVAPHFATEFIAEFSSELLRREPAAGTHGELQQMAFGSLREAGFVTANGRLRARKLFTELNAYYTDILLSTTLRETLGSPGFPSYLRTILPCRKNVHPGAYLLLAAYLHMTSDDHGAQASGTDFRGPVSVRPNERELFAALVASRTLRQAAASVNLSVTTLSVVARRYGFDFNFRPKYVHENIRNDAVNLLFSGATPRQVADQLHLSVPTVYRIRRTRPELVHSSRAQELERLKQKNRGLFVQLMVSYPSHTVTQLRGSDNALWSWLYRNDREWLRAHSPQKMTSCTRTAAPMWPRLELLLLPIIEESIRCLVARNHERITLAAILRTAGVREIPLRKLVEMPTLKILIDSAVEDQLSYVNRRLATAAIGLGAAHATSFSTIIRAARLRPTTVQRAGVDAASWLHSFAGRKDS
jgi:hypothetical protein